MAENFIALDNSFIQDIIIRLQELQKDPDLLGLGNKIISQMNNLRSKSLMSRQPSNYWISRFPTSNSQGYIQLRRAKNSIKTIAQYHNLQHDIELFLAAFLKRDITTYALYYEDDYGNIYRTDMSTVDDSIMNSLYSSKTAQLITLTREAKETLKSLEQTANLTTHIEKYTIATKLAYPQEWRGSVTKTLKARNAGKRARYNLGHIMEAFEIHYQMLHKSIPMDQEYSDWTDKELIHNIKAAMNNTPWYSGGDVKNKQVKFLSSSGSVSTGSQISIETLGNFIKTIIEQKYSVQEIKQIAIGVYKGINNQSVKLNQRVEKTIEKMIETELKTLR